MKKRIFAAAITLMIMTVGIGCSAPVIGSHSACWDSYELASYDDQADYPEGYHWIEGVADMGKGSGELTLCYLTLSAEAEARIVCSLARNQVRGEAAIYWEDPEGEMTLIHDMTGRSGGSGSYTLPEGTSRFLLRADRGRYDVGMGLSGIEKERILSLSDRQPDEEAAASGDELLPRLEEIKG